jgi:GNAT superfamily N-acetyltransferase
LVAHAASLETPRDRTAVLACWMVARLALPRVPRESDFSDIEALAQRADATRRWIGTQGLDAALRSAVVRGCDVAAERQPSLLADAIDDIREAADAVLNNSARAELTTLARLLRRSSLAAMR